MKHFAVRTNLWDWESKRLLEWHREKAGSIEAAHAVIKNELAGRVLPCGRFGANAAYPASGADLQRADRAEAVGAAGGVADRATETAAVPDLQHSGQAGSSCAKADLAPDVRSESLQ